MDISISLKKDEMMIRHLLIILCLFVGGTSCAETAPQGARRAPDATIPKGGLLYFASKNHDTDLAVKNPYIIGALYTIYWSELEVKNGVYDWKALDQFFEKWTAGRKKVAIRVIWVSTGLWPYEVARRPAPSWLWKEGAKYYYDKPTDTEIPLFWDPVYNKYALRLMKAIYERYGQNPDLLFVSATPGYETFPHHPKTEKVSPGFLDNFAKMQDSQGRAYSSELWQDTVEKWITSVSGIFKDVLTFVSLNRGGLYPEEDYFELFGEYAIENHAMVGQNGIKASSYINKNGGRYKLFQQWKLKTSIFQEMALASGNEERQVGTLMGVMEAAVRINTNYLNVYAIDVLKGTKGYKDYDPVYEQALKFGQEQLEFNNK